MSKMTKLGRDGEPMYSTLFCRCGCGNGLVLRAYKYMSGVTLEFVTDIANKHIWTIGEKLKRIWYILTNKEYCYFSIDVDGDDLRRFKTFVAKL